MLHHLKSDAKQFTSSFVKVDGLNCNELKGSCTFKVISYNILSQMHAMELLRPNYHNTISPHILNVKTRRERILYEIKSFDADILCLQDVDDYEDYWALGLSRMGYECIYISNSRAEEENKTGLITAYRKQIFQVFQTKFISLSKLVAQDISDVHILDQLCQQDNIASFVLLQPWEESTLPSAIFVANTQLASGCVLNKRSEIIRVLQAEILAREISAFNRDFQLPIILTGTFNALPSSDVYHLLLSGRIRPKLQTPIIFNRPIVTNPSISTIDLLWFKPISYHDLLENSSEILAYRIAIRNCSTRAIGIYKEIDIPMNKIQAEKGRDNETGGSMGITFRHTIPCLNSDTTYQIQVSAKNEHGWGPYSQPSAPIKTLGFTNKNIITPSSPLSGKTFSQEIFAQSDIKPVVIQQLDAIGYGLTPRIDYTNAENKDICPRRYTHTSKFETLVRRADREESLRHFLILDSVYARYNSGICEPELTFANKQFTGTVDYILYTNDQLVPLMLLQLPNADILTRIGRDHSLKQLRPDDEWELYRPQNWCVDYEDLTGIDQYSGEWKNFEISNKDAQASHYLPNEQFPSAHLALGCVFAMKRQDMYAEWH